MAQSGFVTLGDRSFVKISWFETLFFKCTYDPSESKVLTLASRSEFSSSANVQTSGITRSSDTLVESWIGADDGDDESK